MCVPACLRSCALNTTGVQGIGSDDSPLALYEDAEGDRGILTDQVGLSTYHSTTHMQHSSAAVVTHWGTSRHHTEQAWSGCLMPRRCCLSLTHPLGHSHSQRLLHHDSSSSAGVRGCVLTTYTVNASAPLLWTCLPFPRPPPVCRTLQLARCWCVCPSGWPLLT